MGRGVETRSTLVGLKYPTGRDVAWKTGVRWLEGKQEDDEAESLWRVGDKLYNLESWTKKHPGGEEWITLTKGTDITEAFEAHHVTLTAERLLPKFYVRDAVGPRSCPFTFEDDGFYRRFKARAREALKDVDFHRPSLTSKLIADSLFAATLILCSIAAATQSWIAILSSAISMTWTVITAHNFFHQRDSFRMYYFDMSLMSSKEWRITHALSHHLFPNTLLDFEITRGEPLIRYLPAENKSLVQRYVSWIYYPLTCAAGYFEQGIKRAYSIFYEFDRFEVRDLVPFVVPTLMCFVAPLPTAIFTWLKIVTVASLHFFLVGSVAAHHHPDIYHDGDARREETDWGLAQLDAVRDRVEIETSIFFVLTNFGSHTLHHLLPTVDHSYLRLCEPAFVQTCEEFGLDPALWTQWKLFKGQFLQLANNQPKTTPNRR